MTIKIKCPACKARNTLYKEQQTCRRCSIDLSQLYAIKAYSYSYRLQLLQILTDTDNPKRVHVAHLATSLKNKIL